MTLTKNSECFYYQDTILDDKTYRVFSYRLASYSDFQNSGALECRGHMFEVSGEQALRLAALPPEKFFNLNENPFTMNVDLSTVKTIAVKADGSLISTFLHGDTLRLKSKTSLQSEQAFAAMSWLDKQDNWELKLKLFQLGIKGYTVNMEWVAPSNQIVLGYSQEQLIILNCRNTKTGEYINVEDIFPELHPYVIETISVDDFNCMELVEAMHTLENVEGYVLQLQSGQKIKIKTDWYLLRHRAKDNVGSLSVLYELILKEQIDDIKTLFAADTNTIDRINLVEHNVNFLYNHLVYCVEKFHNDNKTMTRKDYAILGQKELQPEQFVLAMLKFQNKPVDYKEFMIKCFDKFKSKLEGIEQV